ncbi:MAG: hypothetical protein AAFV25_19930 [Bacteroidota bacterium]
MSLSQFNRIRAIRMDEGASATSDQLLKLARLFECRVDDLLNDPFFDE